MGSVKAYKYCKILIFPRGLWLIWYQIFESLFRAFSLVFCKPKHCGSDRWSLDEVQICYSLVLGDLPSQSSKGRPNLLLLDSHWILKIWEWLGSLKIGTWTNLGKVSVGGAHEFHTQETIKNITRSIPFFFLANNKSSYCIPKVSFTNPNHQ